ncbi:MAG: cardiolipin synthase [Thermoanaerobaculia bacterium]
MKRRTKKMWIVIALVIVFHVVGFFSSLDAVMSARTSQGAIAWAVSLNTFHYLAVPAYWVLGRSRFEGYVNARQDGDHEIRHIALGAKEQLMDVISQRSSDNQSSRAGEQIARIPYLRGNEVELLVDGQATFDNIFAGIDAAKEYVLVQFFIVKDDEIGRELHSRLVTKAKEGVRVYFLYDEVGSHSLSKSYINELREAGAQILDFHTRKGPGNRFQINFRNHRKIVVVDGHTAWVGGHNVGDEYMGRDPEFGHWRDTHIRITGPAALAVQLSFLEDWYWATGKAPEFGWAPHLPGGEGKEVLIFPTGPADRLESATLMFLTGINAARERVWIASPYFVPDESLMNALYLAALRGVDVRIIIPDKADQTLVSLAAYSYFEEAALSGIRFFRYMDGFLHQKVVLIDDELSAIGTANFDNRSFRLNFEITAVVADPAFAAEVEQMLIADMEKSVEMQPGDVEKKSFWFRLGTRLARLTSPIQ